MDVFGQWQCGHCQFKHVHDVLVVNTFILFISGVSLDVYLQDLHVILDVLGHGFQFYFERVCDCNSNTIESLLSTRLFIVRGAMVIILIVFLFVRNSTNNNNYTNYDILFASLGGAKLIRLWEGGNFVTGFSGKIARLFCKPDPV